MFYCSMDCGFGAPQEDAEEAVHQAKVAQQLETEAELMVSQ